MVSNKRLLFSVVISSFRAVSRQMPFCLDSAPQMCHMQERICRKGLFFFPGNRGALVFACFSLPEKFQTRIGRGFPGHGSPHAGAAIYCPGFCVMFLISSFLQRGLSGDNRNLAKGISDVMNSGFSAWDSSISCTARKKTAIP